MNPIQETTNDYVVKIKFNMGVILDAVDLGPPPQMVRAPAHNVYEDFQLISDASFQNTPDNFVMPEPCGNCYTFTCNGLCSQESELVPRQLSFEEENDLPPSPALTRILTNAHLPDDEPEDDYDVELSLHKTSTNTTNETNETTSHLSYNE